MTDEQLERLERQIAFIVEQQAQGEVRAARADERSAQADERAAKLDARWERTEASVRDLLRITELQATEIDLLAKSLTAVDARGKATDERLNALVNVVERQISDRNGKGQ